jgi:predicted Rossmann fold nucleotide-binding protein DprA/Smf involved in DNA uptake
VPYPLSVTESLGHGERVIGCGCKLVNWTKPEFPQSLMQIYDPPVVLYVRGDACILNSPSLGIGICSLWTG